MTTDLEHLLMVQAQERLTDDQLVQQYLSGEITLDVVLPAPVRAPSPVPVQAEPDVCQQDEDAPGTEQHTFTYVEPVPETWVPLTEPIGMDVARERVYDMTCTLSERMQAVQCLYDHSIDELVNVLSTLLQSFSYRNNTHLKNYIVEISRLTNIPRTVRFQLLNQLCYAPRNADTCYAALADLCSAAPPAEEQVPALLYVDQVLFLVTHDSTHTHLFQDNVLSNTDYDEQLRMQFLTLSRTRISPAFYQTMLEWSLDTHVFSTRLEIVCFANLLTLGGLKGVEKYSSAFQSIMRDEARDDNTRADIADLLLTHGPPEWADEARTVLTQLGTRGLSILSNVYDNKQNVHDAVNLDEMMAYLRRIAVPTTDAIEDIERVLLENCAARGIGDASAITFSFFRIRNQIGAVMCNTTLLEIIQRIWEFIQQHASRTELLERLAEELTEASETCSSGYYIRMLNVLSGFSDMSVQISFAKQIQAMMFHRLNHIIHEYGARNGTTDELLAELMQKSMRDRPLVRQLYLENISSIVEAIRPEFTPPMTVEEFDQHTTRAMMLFEA